MGWVGLGRGLHRRWAPTASVAFPHRLDWALPRLSGLTAPQTADDPRTPPRRWWEGGGGGGGGPQRPLCYHVVHLAGSAMSLCHLLLLVDVVCAYQEFIFGKLHLWPLKTQRAPAPHLVAILDYHYAKQW